MSGSIPLKKRANEIEETDSEASQKLIEDAK